MLRGTLKAEYRRCGKADCPCAKDLDKRHGPYHYLVWQEDGRRKRVYVPKEQLEEVRAAVTKRRALLGDVRRVVREADQACRESRAALAPPEPPARPAPDVSPEEHLHRAVQVWGMILGQMQAPDA